MDWTPLLEKHGSSLVLYARQWTGSHADAEEAVQDGFIRAWRRKQDERDVDRIVPYLFRAVKSAALDGWRKRTRRKKREIKASDDSYGRQPVFETRLEDQERNAEIQACLERIPAAQREVIVMKIWGDLTFKQIAKSLNVPQNTASSRYRRALDNLKKLVGKDLFHG